MLVEIFRIFGRITVKHSKRRYEIGDANSHGRHGSSSSTTETSLKCVYPASSLCEQEPSRCSRVTESPPNPMKVVAISSDGDRDPTNKHWQIELGNALRRSGTIALPCTAYVRA
ncbi:hypothetical protein WA026_003568 [Henosepilachna vigintioctopunctata]|uniref:Uncharacterized protein n=1 Tax=Henosepilachna vigintioctopunctata TaxID=420089 RepID=A0AAW1TNU9_9CUCU